MKRQRRAWQDNVMRLKENDWKYVLDLQQASQLMLYV
jgi:hypothetical protein